MKSLFIFALSFMAVLSACGQKENMSQSVNNSSLEIEMPVIPDNLTEPAQRADYALVHFWDNVDFTDPKWAADTAMLEQNFANFIQFFPYGTEKGGRESAAILLRKSAVNPKVFDLMISIADKYLYDPNSPMLDEKAYSYFLTTLLSMENLSSSQKELYEFQLAEIRLNSPGSKVSNFSFIDRNGKTHSLHSFAGKTPFTLLGFYDPECDHCKEIIGLLRSSEGLNTDIREGKINVIAVYSGDNRNLWESTKAGMPEGWTVGYDLTGVEDKDLYINRAMPTFYLLDADFTVVGKDVQVQTILRMTEQK